MSDEGRRRTRSHICALACALGLLGAAPAHAGVTVDNATSSTGTTTSLSWSHTVGTGTKRLLIVGVSNASDKTVDSVTYGGTALTKVVDQQSNGHRSRATIWYLVGPPAGAANVVATLSASIAVVGAAVSFTGVDPTTPLGTAASAGGQSTAPSVIVSSAAGEVVIDTMATDGDAISQSAGGGQTAQWNTATGTTSNDVRGGGSTEAGAASVTMSWALNQSKAWAITAVPLKPARRVIIVQ